MEHLPPRYQDQYLEELLTKNRITLQNLQDLDQNFKKLLPQNSTIHYNNCHNLTINLDSKINRILFENCSNIKIKLNGLISGIFIEECEHITVTAGKHTTLNSVTVHDSNQIKMVMSKESYKRTIYDIDKQYSVLLADDQRLLLKSRSNKKN